MAVVSEPAPLYILVSSRKGHLHDCSDISEDIVHGKLVWLFSVSFKESGQKVASVCLKFLSLFKPGSGELELALAQKQILGKQVLVVHQWRSSPGFASQDNETLEPFPFCNCKIDRLQYPSSNGLYLLLYRETQIVWRK
jgi:hypothetical protein